MRPERSAPDRRAFSARSHILSVLVSQTLSSITPLPRGALYSRLRSWDDERLTAEDAEERRGNRNGFYIFPPRYSASSAVKNSLTTIKPFPAIAAGRARGRLCRQASRLRLRLHASARRAVQARAPALLDAHPNHQRRPP